jgi:hypothetical protein
MFLRQCAKNEHVQNDHFEVTNILFFFDRMLFLKACNFRRVLLLQVKAKKENNMEYNTS